MNTQAKKEKLTNLCQFIGTENYYQLNRLMPRVLATDGVQYLCEHGSAFWLFDLIAFYSIHRKIRNEPIIFWRLKVKPDRSAQIVAERDKGDVILRRNIPYTDFPLDEIGIWQGNEPGRSILMLPSEY